MIKHCPALFSGVIIEAAIDESWAAVAIGVINYSTTVGFGGIMEKLAVSNSWIGSIEIEQSATALVNKRNIIVGVAAGDCKAVEDGGLVDSAGYKHMVAVFSSARIGQQIGRVGYAAIIAAQVTAKEGLV
jgi:hypothetical protein